MGNCATTQESTQENSNSEYGKSSKLKIKFKLWTGICHTVSLQTKIQVSKFCCWVKSLFTQQFFQVTQELENQAFWKEFV
jgi:hypothetical protein